MNQNLVAFPFFVTKHQQLCMLLCRHFRRTFLPTTLRWHTQSLTSALLSFETFTNSTTPTKQMLLETLNAIERQNDFDKMNQLWKFLNTTNIKLDNTVVYSFATWCEKENDGALASKIFSKCRENQVQVRICQTIHF